MAKLCFDIKRYFQMVAARWLHQVQIQIPFHNNSTLKNAILSLAEYGEITIDPIIKNVAMVRSAWIAKKSPETTIRFPASLSSAAATWQENRKCADRFDSGSQAWKRVYALGTISCCILTIISWPQIYSWLSDSIHGISRASYQDIGTGGIAPGWDSDAGF